MENKCKSPLNYMGFIGIIFFILKIETRRQLKYKLNSKRFIKNNLAKLVHADSLYANQNIMQMCEEYGWKYIITFKEGSIPNVYKEFESLKKLVKGNKKDISKEKVEQEFRWVNEIEYEGHKVNIVIFTSPLIQDDIKLIRCSRIIAKCN